MIHSLVNDAALVFFALFPVLNPPAMSPIFLEMTSSLPDEDRHRLAGLIGRYTFMMLFVVLVAAEDLRHFRPRDTRGRRAAALQYRLEDA